jgi:hypothetical protein
LTTFSQSYTYLTAADTAQKEVEAKLLKDGFNGFIMMRIKAVVQTQTTNPGTSYANWYGYNFGYGYGVSYSIGSSDNNAPSTVDVNSPKDYIVETNINTLELKMLLWSGVTATMSAKKK